MNSRIVEIINKIENQLLQRFWLKLTDNITNKNIALLWLFVCSQLCSNDDFDEKLPLIYKVYSMDADDYKKTKSNGEIIEYFAKVLISFISDIYEEHKMFNYEEYAKYLVENKTFNEMIEQTSTDKFSYTLFPYVVKELISREQEIPHEIAKVALNIYCGNIRKPRLGSNIVKDALDYRAALIVWFLVIFLKLKPTTGEDKESRKDKKNGRGNKKSACELVVMIKKEYTLNALKMRWYKYSGQFIQNNDELAYGLSQELSKIFNQVISEQTSN